MIMMMMMVIIVMIMSHDTLADDHDDCDERGDNFSDDFNDDQLLTRL